MASQARLLKQSQSQQKIKKKTKQYEIPTPSIKISEKVKEYTMKGTKARKLMASIADDFEIPETGTEYGDVPSIERLINSKRTI